MQVINHFIFKEEAALALENKERIVILDQTEGLFSQLSVFLTMIKSICLGKNMRL